jgi:putative ABC transport system permease protein
MDSSRQIRLAIYRKKFGAVLIAVQIAITLAILSNAVTLIAERLSWSSQSTGIDEDNIFFAYAENVDVNPIWAQSRRRILALRAMPGVGCLCDEFLSPAGGGWSMSVGLVPSQKHPQRASYHLATACMQLG